MDVERRRIVVEYQTEVKVQLPREARSKRLDELDDDKVDQIVAKAIQRELRRTERI